MPDIYNKKNETGSVITHRTKRADNQATGKRSKGKNIAAYCSHCKVSRDHSIVAIGADGKTVEKVKCRNCGRMHKYRINVVVKTGKAAKKKYDAAKTAETLWETSLSETKGRERVYDMSGKYRVGDIVLHSTFGKRIAERVGQTQRGWAFVPVKPGNRFVEFGSVTVEVGGQSKSEVTRNIKKGQFALARAVENIVKPGVEINVVKGVPLFHADSEHPGQIIRELDGRRVIGRFVNGKFRISR